MAIDIFNVSGIPLQDSLVANSIIKHGNIIVNTAGGGGHESFRQLNTSVFSGPTIAVIQEKYDARFDDPRYYSSRFLSMSSTISVSSTVSVAMIETSTLSSTISVTSTFNIDMLELQSPDATTSSTLVLWLKSRTLQFDDAGVTPTTPGTGLIQEWHDQVSTYVFDNTTVGEQPTLGLAPTGAIFAGGASNDHLANKRADSPFFQPRHASGTVMASISHDTSTSEDICFSINADDSFNRYIKFGVEEDGKASVRHRAINTTDRGGAETVAIFPSGTKTVVWWSSDGDVYRIGFNNTEQTVQVVGGHSDLGNNGRWTSDLAEADQDNVAVGAQAAGSPIFEWDGSVDEVCMWGPGPLSDTEREKVVLDMTSRGSITV